MTDKTKREVLLDTVKMVGVGIKPKKHRNYPSAVESGPCYPDLYLDTEQVPDLKGNEVGKEITLVVKGIVRSHSLNENTTSDTKKVDQRESFSITIKQIGLVK